MKKLLALLLAFSLAQYAPANAQILLLGVDAAQAAGGSSPTATYIATTDTGSITGVSTHTFTAASIGTAAADRLVVVVAHTFAGAATSISSISIGGVTATLDAANASQNSPSAIAHLLVTTGTTANIIVNTAANQTDFVISVYTVTGYVAATPENANAATAAINSSATLTFTPSAGGVTIFGAAQNGQNTMTPTWSGGGSLVQDVQANTPTLTKRYVDGRITGMTNISGNLVLPMQTVVQSLVFAEWH